MKTEEQVFQIPMIFNNGNDMILEFFVCGTNEINPHRELKELGVVIYEKDEEKRKSIEYRQMDNRNKIGVDEIESLIKYLQKVKKHIKAFNENSKPAVSSVCTCRNAELEKDSLVPVYCHNCNAYVQTDL